MTGEIVKELVQDWWHGSDFATAADLLTVAIAPWGAAPITEAELRHAMEAFDDVGDDDAEDELRRHQIGWAARRANAALAAAGREERVRAFAHGADSEGSAWRVCLPSEYAGAIAELGAPEQPEGAWDDARVADPIAESRKTPREKRIAPANALRIGEDAYRAGDWALAVRAAQLAFDHGDLVIGALLLMESLVRAGRKTDARALWLRVAGRWLQGFTYPLFRHQWDRLLAVRERLELPDDALVAGCRASRDQAPRRR